MMIRPKPRDVSDAYALLAVLADPEGAKERLDEILKATEDGWKAVEASREAKERAELAQKDAESAMESLKIKSEAHKKNVDEYHAARDALMEEKSVFSAQVSESESTYKAKNDDMVVRERKAADTYNAAARLETEAKALMSKAEAMKAEYEMKLKRLKEMS